MSEPTFEQMRRTVWQNFGYPNDLLRSPKPPEGWPDKRDAVNLLRDVQTIVNVHVHAEWMTIGFGVYIGQHDSWAETLGEAAIRCAYAQIKGGDEK